MLEMIEIYEDDLSDIQIVLDRSDLSAHKHL